MQAITITRLLTDAVVETPNGAHFTSCDPDYGRDEAFQSAYAKAAADVDGDGWSSFAAKYLEVDEAGYQAAVREGASA